MLLERDDLDASATKTLTRIESAAARAERMIRDLLDYTQAHLGGGIHVDRKPNDLGRIVRRAMDEIEVAHPDHTHELVDGGNNTGSTIPADRLGQIFEPMHQIAPGSGRNQRSVGLRLYIVDSIVTSHHGTIGVTSNDIEGTTFTVRIPRQRSALPHAA